MHVTCENHAWRCPQVPGRVCTVVPVSGSRSSLLITRFWSELGSNGQARYEPQAVAAWLHNAWADY